MSLINSFLLALLLTVAIELAVAALFSFRKKREIIAIVFINLLTNPILNYSLWLNDYFAVLPSSWWLLPLLELAVVLLEWRLLLFVCRGQSGRLLKLSILMNLASYVVGFLIQ